MEIDQKLKFDELVWEEVKTIPVGKAATYGFIAVKIGKPRAARAVGNALNKNLYRDSSLTKSVPCHRVIRSDGSVGGFARGTEAKIKLLRSEGVQIAKNRVLKKYII